MPGHAPPMAMPAPSMPAPAAVATIDFSAPHPKKMSRAFLKAFGATMERAAKETQDAIEAERNILSMMNLGIGWLVGWSVGWLVGMRIVSRWKGVRTSRARGSEVFDQLSMREGRKMLPSTRQPRKCLRNEGWWEKSWRRGRGRGRGRGRLTHLEKVNWRRMVSGRITRPFCIAIPKARPMGTAETARPDQVVADIPSTSSSSLPPTSSYCWPCVLALCATCQPLSYERGSRSMTPL